MTKQYVDYHKYIKSNAWRRKRTQFIASKSHNCRCYACGSASNLHIHHRSYKRLGNENIGLDLIYLCAVCHETVHREMVAKKGLFTAAKHLRKRNIKQGRYYEAPIIDHSNERRVIIRKSNSTTQDAGRPK